MSAPSFSFPIDVIALSNKGRDYDLVADDAARAALARELGLESLENLRAQVTVVPAAGHAVEVTGRFEADVVQACVVTLKPVAAHLSDTITRRFVPEAPQKKEPPPKAPKEGTKKEGAKPEPADGEGWIDPNAEISDPLINGVIDLGEVVTEQLALALNPYPRAPGAAFPGVSLEGPAGPASDNPFAALAGLKVGKAAPRRAERKDGAKARPGKGKPIR